jgi:energy-coupling factor transporter ATP-binding protein EcfA2
MQDEKKIILVIGKRGSGKSYLVKKLIENETRLLVYDVMSESNPPYFGVTFLTEEKNQFTWFWRQFYKRDFRLVYRPINPKAEIDWIAQCVFALGNMTFVCEEIDSFCTSYDMPESFRYIVQRGRHKNITLIGVTPAPFGINRDLTRQAKEIYVFNTNEPRDIQYLKDLLGNEIEKKIGELKLYEYVKWTDGAGFEPGKA